MKGRKILFLDENAKSRRSCVKILAATRATVTAPKSMDEAKELVDNNFFDIVFADFNCREILEVASKKSPFSKTILLAQVSISDILSYVHKEKYISNFLAKDVDGRIMPEDLLMTTEKILRNDIFGIEKYLTWGVEPFTYQIDDSNRRMEYP